MKRISCVNFANFFYKMLFYKYTDTQVNTDTEMSHCDSYFCNPIIFVFKILDRLFNYYTAIMYSMLFEDVRTYLQF